jgi:hypothetical protein
MTQSLMHAPPDVVEFSTFSDTLELPENTYSASGCGRSFTNWIAASMLFTDNTGSSGPKISSCTRDPHGHTTHPDGHSHHNKEITDTNHHIISSNNKDDDHSGHSSRTKGQTKTTHNKDTTNTHSYVHA